MFSTLSGRLCSCLCLNVMNCFLVLLLLPVVIVPATAQETIRTASKEILSERIAKLETLLFELERGRNRLEELLLHQDNRLQQLESDKQLLQDNVQRLENNVFMLIAEKQKLEDRVQDLENNVRTLKSENVELRDRVFNWGVDSQQMNDCQTVLNWRTLLNHCGVDIARDVVAPPWSDVMNQYEPVVNETTSLVHAATGTVHSIDGRMHKGVNEDFTKDRTARADDVGKDSVVGGDRPKLKDSVAGGDHDVVARSDDTSPLEPVIAQMSQRLTEMSAKLDVMQNAKIQQDTAIQQAASSVYVRWGRSTCAQSAQLVYSGVVGGSKFQDTGAATNYLCLSLSPVSSDHPVPKYMAYLHGAEYHTFDARQNKDPVCAMCRSQHSTVIMVPGTNVCMTGWVQEYGGFLMTGDPIDHAGSEYICVDSALEDRIGTDAETDGKLLYYTVTRCGGLPCSPYVNNTVVTCAVCSK